MNAPEITILPETTDTRPEPPPMPDMWTVRSFAWIGPSANCWMAMTWTGNRTEAEAMKHAEYRLRQGDRRVQVIKIGGDA